MKLNKILVIAIGLLALGSINKVTAQVAPPPNGYSAFSLGSSATIASTNTYYVGSMFSSKVGQTPVLTYLTCKSDFAGSLLTLYWAQASGQQSVSNNSTTTIYLGGTNGITTGNPVVIRHQTPPDTYDARVVSTITAYNVSTNVSPFYPNNSLVTTNWAVVLSAAPTYAVATNDVVWGYASQSTVPVGNASLTIGPVSGNSGFALPGQYQTPFLISIDFSTAGQIYAGSGTYLP